MPSRVPRFFEDVAHAVIRVGVVGASVFLPAIFHFAEAIPGSVTAPAAVVTASSSCFSWTLALTLCVLLLVAQLARQGCSNVHHRQRVGSCLKYL